MFHTYLLLYGLPDDLWEFEMCWRLNVLIIELDTDMMHLSQTFSNNVHYKMILSYPYKIKLCIKIFRWRNPVYKLKQCTIRNCLYETVYYANAVRPLCSLDRASS